MGYKLYNATHSESILLESYSNKWRRKHKNEPILQQWRCNKVDNDF